MPLNPRAAAAAAVAAVCLLPSCETVRTVKSVESRGINQSDPLAERFVGQSVERWNNGEQHSMDRQRIDTGDLWGGDRGNNQFGGREYGRKEFGRKMFGKTEQYKSPQYHFIEEREVAHEEAAAASSGYYAGDREAGEGKRRWFWQKKGVSREAAYEAERLAPEAGGRPVDRPGLREAEASQEQNRDSDLNIVNPAGHRAAPPEMSIQDVKTMLGR